ncbi:hypothetical protein LXL04_031461 [Taraxacum kok-saghyz]
MKKIRFLNKVLSESKIKILIKKSQTTLNNEHEGNVENYVYVAFLETRKPHVTCKAQTHHMRTIDIQTNHHLHHPPNMEKQPSSTTTAATTTTMSPATPVSNLYDSYEFRAISKQLNRAIKGSNSPLSPYSFYLKSATPFYPKQSGDLPRAKGFVSRLWAKGLKKPEIDMNSCLERSCWWRENR